MRKLKPGHLTIELPSGSKALDYEAEVVAVGPGRTTDSGAVVMPCCKVGDIVMLHASAAGFELSAEGETLHLFNNVEILAILPHEGYIDITGMKASIQKDVDARSGAQSSIVSKSPMMPGFPIRRKN